MTSPRADLARAAGDHPKTPLSAFLARNPFPNPRTLGSFYREKMRAVHHLAPNESVHRVLDVGGGRGGIAAMLWPRAQIVVVDLDPSHAEAGPNRWPGVAFVPGDATKLPFPDDAFDVVLLLDVLEHVPDDAAVAREALRVLRSGGSVLASTPLDTWRYPWFSILKPICRPESALMEEWGHVRRGYHPDALEALFGAPPAAVGSFVNRWTALGHDLAFSRLPRPIRLGLWLLQSPLWFWGWYTHGPGTPGTEIVALWKKP